MQKIVTERLILDAWHRRDAAALFSYAKSPNVGPQAGWAPHESVAESKMRIRRLFKANKTWKIMTKERLVAIGSIGFEPEKRREGVDSRELGYSLSEEYWGQGIMTEAGMAVVGYGFETLGLDVITLTTAPDNIRSQRVAEKIGFSYEGCLRDSYLTYDGKIRDTYCYSLLRREWENRLTAR